MNSEFVQASRLQAIAVRPALGGKRFIRRAPVALVLFLALVLFTEPVFSQSSRRSADPDQNLIEKLEFRSILSFGGDVQVSLKDPVRDMSFWIRLHESRHGITLINYFPENDQIEVRYGNHTRRIGLKDAEILPIRSEENSQVESQDGIAGNQRSSRHDRQEQVRHMIETWDAEAEGNSRLRAIDEHLNEYYREFDALRQRMWATTDHESAEFQELRARRQELREEIQVLNNLTLAEIENNPSFEDIDHGSLMATLRLRHLDAQSDSGN